VSSAVVIGGSIAGLVAAAALSETLDDVIICERDELLDGPVLRKGVGQGKQIHGYQPVGIDGIESLLPGFRDDLVADGAAQFDLATLAHFGPDGWTLRAELGYGGFGCSRPLFEWAIRRRVNEIDNIRVIQDAVVGLTASDDRSQVTGVALKGSDRVLNADLVVDASGRGSQASKWLEDLGYARPREMHVRMFMGYTSVMVEFPDGVLPEDNFAFVALPYPGHLRGGVILCQENGLYMLTASGFMRDYPPRTYEEMLEFLDDAATPLVGQFAREAKPLTEPHLYKMPGNQRRLWEALDPRPGRFFAVGDSVASFDPIHGQGVSVAGVEAAILRDLMRDHGGDLDIVPGAFQQSIASLVETCFRQSAGGDAFYEGAELEGTDPPYSDEEATYIDDIAAMATFDAEALRGICEGIYRMDEPALYTDELKSRVAAWNQAGRPMQDSDPNEIPAIVPAAKVPEHTWDPDAVTLQADGV
jgi:2-polyprenyl-6-methoxyphenol hydroxylase-like FAD-dependent oxidoreductase